MPIRGEVWLDGGALTAVQDRKKSLFSAGIVAVSGQFHAQVCVSECFLFLGGGCTVLSCLPGRSLESW